MVPTLSFSLKFSKYYEKISMSNNMVLSRIYDGSWGLEDIYYLYLNLLIWMLRWKFTIKIREEVKQLTLRYLLATLKPV